MDFSEKWGRSVEEAVDLALQDLRLDRDQVKVTVVEEPSKGFFGIGSKLAKVRVEKCSAEDRQREEAHTGKKEKKEPKEKKAQIEPREKKEKEPKEPKQRREIKEKVKSKETCLPRTVPEDHERLKLRERPDDLVEITENVALDFLNDVTQRMAIEVEVKGMGNADSLYFDISGKDSGTIIGKRGQTLDSIQYLTSLVANKGKEKYYRVIVDAENYREKRERTLEQLAERLADKVVRTGKSVRLEPMNPYERKVIHATLQKNPKVTTKSQGEEPYRRVIIQRS